MADLSLLELADKCAIITQGLKAGLNELIGTFGASDPRRAKVQNLLDILRKMPASSEIIRAR
jgi:hypothetical protein